MVEPIPWHELLALILLDFFGDSSFGVDTEKDLSLKKQYLDLVLFRKGPGEFGEGLPDGPHPLAAHNLRGRWRTRSSTTTNAPMRPVH